MIKNAFSWLQKWYSTHHAGGLKNVHIKVYSVDNPGMRFVVNLSNIGLENFDFEEVNFQGNLKDDWFICFVREEKFESACGPRNLSQTVAIFRKWIEKNSSPSTEGILKEPQELLTENEEMIFSWLQDWYYNHCNSDWEHDWRVRIETCDSPGWQIRINCIDTGLEGRVFEPLRIKEKDGWLTCNYHDNIFAADCSPDYLLKAIATFRTWTERV